MKQYPRHRIRSGNDALTVDVETAWQTVVVEIGPNGIMGTIRLTPEEARHMASALLTQAAIAEVADVIEKGVYS